MENACENIIFETKYLREQCTSLKCETKSESKFGFNCFMNKTVVRDEKWPHADLKSKVQKLRMETKIWTEQVL